MARIKKKREGKKGKDTIKTHKGVIFHTRVTKTPNVAISTKLGTVVDLTYVVIYANFGWYRLKCGHFAVL